MNFSFENKSGEIYVPSSSRFINSSDVESAFNVIPDAVINPSLANLSAAITNNAGKSAEIVQKCANAGCCVLRYDRDGVLYVEPLKETLVDYIPIVSKTTGIPLSVSYTYPEITLSKPLKSVSVDYGGETPHILSVASSGEQQTLSNDFIGTTTQAAAVATWVSKVLKMRKTISGEFRADPRLELYDIVNVEDRYGRVLKVAITNIKYDFNGSFRGSYTGRVIEEV